VTTLPVAEARAQLSKLIDEAASTHERFEITRNGQRAAVLLGAEDFDAYTGDDRCARRLTLAP
jgi:antitoxin YefM